MSEWRRVALGDVVTHDVEPVLVVEQAAYPIVGVLNRGRGLLHRGSISAADTKYASLNAVREGQLVYSKLKAFEGAITVATGLGDSVAYASPEFPTFTCGAHLLPRYMALVTCLPSFWESLARLSTGIGGRRERVAPRALLTIEIPLPPVEVQRRLVDLVGALDSNIAALEVESSAAWKLLHEVRELTFSSVRPVELGAVCSIESKLVDPSDRAYADWPHIGIEAIEKDTGRVLGARTVTEDALVSGKHVVEPGEVIYSKIRPNLRKVAVYGARALCSADAYPLRPIGGLEAGLLREALLTDAVVERVVGMSGRTKMPKVNRGELFSVAVPLGDPAAWPEHAQTLKAVRNAAEALLVELDALRAVRAELVPALLSGHLQVTESYNELVGAP